MKLEINEHWWLELFSGTNGYTLSNIRNFTYGLQLLHMEKHEPRRKDSVVLIITLRVLAKQVT